MADPERGDETGYWLRYLAASAVILAAVWALVTRILPPRLMPTADFRERVVHFSTEPPDFEVPARTVLRAEPEPVPPPEPSGEPAMGPRGRLWEAILPLLEANRFGAAVPRMERYLAEHPEDRALRLELARTLLRAGRLEEAETQFRRLVQADDPEGIVGLARVLWRRDRLRPAAEQLRRSLELRPDDEDLRSSLARLLRTLGDYPGAARHYRELIRTAERPDRYRVELARTLLWSGDPLAALAELHGVEDPSARELAERIRSTLALPAPDPVTSDPLARARRALAAGDLEEASSLFRLTTLLRPHRTAAWLEWSDLLARRLGDPGRAASVLEEHLDRSPGGPAAAARRRLARYAVWAGEEERARRVLAELASEGRAEPGDLVLLGDLLRWSGRWGRSSRLYRRALSRPEADSAAVRAAERGLDAIRARDRAAVAARDPRRARVSADRLDDSDGLGRTELRGEARFGPGSGPGLFTAVAEWTRLEGARVPGTGSVGAAEVGYLRWFDHASTRLAVSAGAERRSGAEAPRLSADLLLLDRMGDRLGVEASRRSAHGLTRSLASLRRGQGVTGAGLSLGQDLGGGASFYGRARADVLDDVGAGGNLRLLGTAAWERAVTDRLRLGVSSRLLSFTSPAFDAGGRPGYWSPELSWTPSAVLDWRLEPGARGFGLHARLRPGLSVVKLHGRESTRAGSSLNATGGALYRWGRATAEATLSYLRSRAGEYDALSAGLALTWRF